MAAQSICQIEESVEKGERFLSWTSFTEPHPPFYPPKEIYESIDQSAIELPALPPDSAAPAHPRIRKMQEEWAHLTGVEKRQLVAGYNRIGDDSAGSRVEGLVERLKEWEAHQSD